MNFSPCPSNPLTSGNYAGGLAVYRGKYIGEVTKCRGSTPRVRQRMAVVCTGMENYFIGASAKRPCRCIRRDMDKSRLAQSQEMRVETLAAPSITSATGSQCSTEKETNGT